ncbi:MAG: hypothetical protein M1298_05320 [Chloroflexi bacterium]|nr:hypothetical protein [Chloroflexota bacterium]
MAQTTTHSVSLQHSVIDFVMIADRAEVVNNKLYMLGGAWDTFLAAAKFPISLSFSIVVAILTPWHETNNQQTFTIRCEDSDGHLLIPALQAQFVVGRPPWAKKGQQFRSIFVANISLSLNQSGSYLIRTTLASGDTKAIEFHVISASAQPSDPK